MKILDYIKTNYKSVLRNLAHLRIIRWLEKSDLSYKALEPWEFEEEVRKEMKILEGDVKKVAVGIGVGFALSMLLGF